MVFKAVRDGRDRGKFIADVLTRLMRSSKRKTIAEPKYVDDPVAIAILIRGGGSLINDETFEILEARLPEIGVRVVRFSYAGFSTTLYSASATIKMVATASNQTQLTSFLDQYLANTPSHLPVFLLGHSLGGLTMVWATCRAETLGQQFAERIRKAFFFATPFASNTTMIPFNPKAIGLENIGVDVLLIPLQTPYNIHRLSQLSSIYVFRSIGDGFFPDEKETSLEINHVNGAPFPMPSFEDKFPAPHDKVCNHEAVVRHVLSEIQVVLTES